MLYHTVRNLCIALSVQSLVSGVASRPFDGKNPRCTSADCETKKLDVGTNIGTSNTTFNTTVVPLWSETGLRLPSVADKSARAIVPRVVEPIPITVPKPAPKPADEPNGTPPGAKPDGSPATDPTGSDAQEEADVIAKTCTPAPDGAKKRSECHTGISEPEDDEESEFGENPEVDPPELAGEAQPAAVQITDFFALVRSENPGSNDARDALEARIRDNTPDEPIPDIASFDNVYEPEQADMVDITRSAGRPAARDLLERAGVNYDHSGIHFSFDDRAGTRIPFHESTWSKDGTVGFADFSDRSLDKTAADARLPWFKVMMHIRTQRLPRASPLQDMPTMAIGQIFISNKSTVKTIESIFAALSPEDDDFLVLNAGAAPGSDEAFAFDAISRTDNGRGTFWLAANYHQALGDKVVTRILLRNAKPQDGRLPTAVLILSKAT